MTDDQIAQRNKQLAIELWGRDNLSTDPDPDDPGYPEYYARYYTEDYTNHASFDDGPQGFEGEKVLRRGFMELFSHAHFEVDKAVADGDLVMLSGMFTAKHIGHTLFGIAADGRDVSQEQVHILRFRDGRISDHWAVRDDLTMLRQMEAEQSPEGGIMQYLRAEK
jgi:predicted ester cyclase